MKVLGGILGLVMVFYIAYAPIYAIFFNSPKDAAEKISAAASFENSLDIAKSQKSIDSNIYDMLSSQLANFVKYCDKKNETNLSKPLIKILKNQRNISNIRISEGSDKYMEFCIKHKGPSYCEAELKSGYLSLYTLTWDKENEKFDLPIMVINPSFLKIRSAKAIALDYELMLQTYGITSEQMSMMGNELKMCMMLYSTMLK